MLGLIYKVFIYANFEELKAGKKIPQCKRHTITDGSDVIIVGGGAGGLLAAETLRSEGFAGKITIISREAYLPIDRPKLSKSIKMEASKISLRTAEELKGFDINVILATEVLQVNTDQKFVTLHDQNTMKYKYLVLATGGDPRVLPFPGNDLQNIFVMRNVDDSNAIEAALKNITGKPNVVIVGSSFIGMEAASMLAKSANVTVIGMEKVPFERVLGTAVGEAMAKLNVQNGVTLKMERFVAKYEPLCKYHYLLTVSK